MPSSQESSIYGSTLGLLCDQLDNLFENAKEIVWSLVHQATDSELFTDVSTRVVETILCEGLNSLNYTVWDGLQNVTASATFDSSCEAPQESFCNASLGQNVTGGLDYQSAMNSLLVSYEQKYNEAMQPAVECIEKSNSDVAINYILGQATGSLQDTLGQSMQTSWTIPFQISPNASEAISTDSVNDQIKNFINKTISSEVAEQLVTSNPILDQTQLVSKIFPPVLSSSPDIIQIQDASTNLISALFTQLNTTLTDLKKAMDSNLASLPSYLNLPDLPSSSLCENVWLSRYNTTVLVEAKGSTEDYFCRSVLTACTPTGICLIGLKIIEDADGELDYFPYRFSGRKCYDDPMTKEVMESKEELGALKIYIPSILTISVSIGLAAFFTLLALFLVAFLFIPNVILTSLKYRSGVLPSLRNESFKRYRDNIISLTFLVPVTFWSALAMAIILFGLFSVIFFLLLWEVGFIMHLIFSSLL